MSEATVDIQQVSIKIFARQSELDQEALIPIFHKWIRERRLGDTLLIDVADYRHVPEGPGMMLIGHEAHWSVDTIGGELGMRYGRKRDPMGPARPRLHEALCAALLAAHALEQEPAMAGKLSFDPGRLEIQVMSRLAGLNTDETHAALLPEIQSVLAERYGGAAVTITRDPEPRRPYGVRATVDGAPPLASLLA